MSSAGYQTEVITLAKKAQFPSILIAIVSNIVHIINPKVAINKYLAVVLVQFNAYILLCILMHIYLCTMI